MIDREIADIYGIVRSVAIRLALLSLERQALGSIFIGYLITEDNTFDPAIDRGVEPDFKIGIIHHPAGKPAFDNDVVPFLRDLLLAGVDHFIKRGILPREVAEPGEFHVVFFCQLAEDLSRRDHREPVALSKVP
eukprot:TRINITY_DN23016_c0_g1_i2.p2 TRINITY_DN23016_c0_g1~~TRINITY_DN23016_c0_g1_i2.p2  ORF type:complete len:134 (+),score=1.39 TRINITY_DN23016_c0_g1_i2:318-719(+)